MPNLRIEDAIVWQKSRVFTRLIYAQFGKSKDFGFRDQILRAALSVMNNLAEGIESGTSKELKRYFSIAKGSCGEVRSMLYAAYDIRYISHKDFLKLQEHAQEIAKIIASFRKNIR
ncbi:MAG: four helix bundle protein [Patescibacteria group bacterium]